MSILEKLNQAAAQGEQERKAAEEGYEEIYKRTVVAPMQPYIDAAPGEIKQIREMAPTVMSVRSKLNGTHYARDQVIARSVHEIDGLVENGQTIETGLKEYAKLSRCNLLDRKGNFDTNASANLVGWLRGYFPSGSKKAIEALLVKIEDRLSFLMQYSENLPPEKPVQATIVPPQKKSASDESANDNWDPRLP